MIATRATVHAWTARKRLNLLIVIEGARQVPRRRGGRGQLSQRLRRR